MARKNRKRKLKNNKKVVYKAKKSSSFNLPEDIKRMIWAIVMFLIALIVGLAFFELAGEGGALFVKGSKFVFGKAIYALPVFLIFAGLAFWRLKYKNKWPIVLAVFLLLFGLAGIFECLNHEIRQGGWAGFLITYPFLKAFGLLATQIIFGAVIVSGGVILWQFLHRPKEKVKEEEEEKPALIKRIFAPKFNVKPVEEPLPPLITKEDSKEKPPILDLKTKVNIRSKDYHFPPLDLLEPDRGIPSAGDIKINSAIIKRTLQNFDISVEMSEVNTGPTVTQYTLKPAEGVKLTKITSLNNDLALALAAHPIRIEAPIPGRPLVGIEIPNKARVPVRLRNLIEHKNFQNSTSNLTLILGRDVAGNPVFADLDRMPHLLVAGATGTGKTICLNTLIMSLLYQNSPDIMKLILIDPKRVEFPVFNALPHLLTPVIFDAQKSVNAFKWLVTEMERRFDVLSQANTRDIGRYNEEMLKRNEEPLPYIVLVVDELADLMAARGREIEGGIVRLAQMARAVGIHLILATQRPSVEVITGLIKANVTSRITFQVASQVDSRTVLDASGAEKLLGLGDMLFVSAEVVKPKRIQAAFTSDKEVKKVVKFIKTENKVEESAQELTQELEKTLENQQSNGFDFASGGGGDDPLYEEAKRVVIEAKKASASLLQRRLRVGYARAARLLDILEEKGVVGPGEGAKPREVFGAGVPAESPTEEKEDDGWQKI